MKASFSFAFTWATPTITITDPYNGYITPGTFVTLSTATLPCVSDQAISIECDFSDISVQQRTNGGAWVSLETIRSNSTGGTSGIIVSEGLQVPVKIDPGNTYEFRAEAFYGYYKYCYGGCSDVGDRTNTVWSSIVTPVMDLPTPFPAPTPAQTATPEPTPLPIPDAPSIEVCDDDGTDCITSGTFNSSDGSYSVKWELDYFSAPEDGFKLYENGTASTQNSDEKDFTKAPTSSLQNFTYQVSANNASGESPKSGSITVAVKNEKPSISAWVSPVVFGETSAGKLKINLDEDNLKDDSNRKDMRLEVTASDVDSTISQVKFYYQDSSSGNKINLGTALKKSGGSRSGDGETANYYLDWDLAELDTTGDPASFEFSLYAEVTDQHNNLTEVEFPFIAYAYNDVPNIAAGDGEATVVVSVTAESVTIKSDATDNYGGVKHVRVYGELDSSGQVAGPVIAEDDTGTGENSARYTFTLDLQQDLGITSAQIKTIYLVATDNHGRVSDDILFTIDVQNTVVPSVTLTANKSSNIDVEELITFDVNADSNEGHLGDYITNIELLVDGSNEGDAVTLGGDENPVSESFTYSFDYPGTRSISVKVTDSFGGTAVSSAETFHVSPTRIPSDVTGASIENATQSISTTEYLDADGSYDFTWDTTRLEAEEGVTSYRVRKTDPTGVVTDDLTFQVGSELKETNLALSGVYQYQVKAVNEIGESEHWSPALYVDVQRDAPAAPDIQLSSIQNSISGDNVGYFTLAWNDTSASFTEYFYVLETRDPTVENAPWEVYRENIPTNAFTFSNKPAGKYEFRVKACNLQGCSADGDFTGAGKQIVFDVLPPFIAGIDRNCGTSGTSCLAIYANSIHQDADIVISSINQTTTFHTYTDISQYWNQASGRFELTVNSTVDNLLDDLQSIHVQITNPTATFTSTSYNESDPTIHLAYSSSAYAAGADGTLYVGFENILYAVNPVNGERIEYGDWPFRTDGEIVATPLVDQSNGNVFIGSKDDHLYGLNKDGFEQWSLNTEGDVLSSGVLDVDQTLYFGSMSGTLYSVASETGVINWAYPVGKPLPYSPVLSGVNNDSLIYFTTEDGQTQVLGRGDLGDGQLAWNAEENSTLTESLLNANWLPSEDHADEFAKVARLYIAILQSQNSENESLRATPFYLDVMTYWTYATVLRPNLEEIATAFLYSNEPLAQALESIVSNGSDDAFLDTLYYRVLAHKPSDGALTIHYGGQPYTREDLLFILGSGEQSREWLITMFTESAENIARDYIIAEYFEIAYNTAVEQIAAILNCNLDNIEACDTDNDGIPDYWEMIHFNDLAIIEAEHFDVDLDGDGLTVGEEIAIGDAPCENDEGQCNDTLVAESLTPAEKVDNASSLVYEMDSIGQINGTFHVNESGAATYTIPLALPAGTAGVAPEVALSYSSQLGNGLLGQGWSLSGTSSIHRCKQTLALDGQAESITWGEDDRFCLDGARLVVENGEVYGAVGASYRTELEGYNYVTSHGGSRGKPSYFTVQSKDGTLSYYGQSSSVNLSQSRTSDDSHVLAWNLNRFEDTAGNGVDFFYETTQGHSIKSISYGYGSDGTKRAEVIFNYAYDRPDPQGGYVGGYDFMTGKRLQSIDVKGSAPNQSLTTLRTYTLNYIDYENDPGYVGAPIIGHISRVKSIRE